MARLHVYVPDDVAETAKARAKATENRSPAIWPTSYCTTLRMRGLKVSSKRLPVAGEVSRWGDRSKAISSAASLCSDVAVHPVLLPSVAICAARDDVTRQRAAGGPADEPSAL